MAQGQTALQGWYDATSAKEKRSAKEDDMLDDAKLVLEYYARGYTFAPIDLSIVNSRHFQIVDDRLMPSLVSINGMGEKAADAVVEAVKDGPSLREMIFAAARRFPRRTSTSWTSSEFSGIFRRAIRSRCLISSARECKRLKVLPAERSDR